MFRAYVERDPAETLTPVLVIQAGRHEFFLWWDYRPRFVRYSWPK